LWDAFKFCRAVKNRTINGSCIAPTTTPKKIEASNVGEARRLFGLFIRQALAESYDDAVFVPVPSKDSHNTVDFRSLAMVREALPIGEKHRAVPLVRFNEPRPKASEGGGRGYNAVYPYLEVSGTPPAGKIYLVDDIITSGGSVLATRDRLVESFRPVEAALVCGRTTAAAEVAFEVRSFELNDHVGYLDF
jgi:hypothetical protein